MKKLFLLFFSIAVVYGCKDKPKTEEEGTVKNAFFETDFSDYRELDALNGYEKQIDTSVHMGGWQDTYRLMNLQKDNNNLVLFYKVTQWDEQEIHHVAYRAIDTLLVNNFEQDERVTVGYCYHEDYYEGEVIALIKKNSGSENSSIIKAWRANPESENIEVLKDHQGIKCIDEFFESENSTIPIEEFS